MPEPRLSDADLVAVTSHEMRTPLAAIRGFTDTLRRRRGEFTDREVGEFLDVIALHTDRLVRMVDDLLAMSRLENGTMTLEPEPVLLVPFLEEVVGDLGEEAARVELRVSTDLPASLTADPLRLRQILTNLLQNAMRYADPHEAVILSAAGTDAGVTFEVIDRGPGIPAEEIERIFEPFFRGQGARSGEGAGLGLAITRRLAGAMGGEVDVTSVPGEGSTFRVSLPA